MKKKQRTLTEIEKDLREQGFVLWGLYEEAAEQDKKAARAMLEQVAEWLTEKLENQ